MNYQVLARKWRPTKFSEVIGQDHVVQSLTNALRHDRLHHAYLFSGTRGVGKTTLARILAKAINCENLLEFNPCGQCRVCQAVDQSRFVDLIEVDAASRTKVEDTRDLLDNVQYAPNSARYKIYLIDEVHMLSGHSFNALLKTLEEPPPHVKFLLATTDPQKIPVTVLSRCLQFNLKRLPPAQIFEQMRTILSAEEISAESQALKLIAQAADGSMRDALSILDQAIVFGGGSITLNNVNAMLGTVAQQSVSDILSALADGDGKRIISLVEQIANVQSDFSVVLTQILNCLYQVALVQQIPGAASSELNPEIVESLAQKLSPQDVQLYYQMALLGQNDLNLAPDSRMGFEMLMLRMLAFRPSELKAGLPNDSAYAIPENQEKAQVADSAKARHQTAPHDTESQAEIKKLTGQAGQSAIVANAADTQGWAEIINRLRLESVTRELAGNCSLEFMDNENCQLILDDSHQHLLSDAREAKLQAALQNYFGRPMKLAVKIGSPTGQTPAAQRVQQAEARQQAAIEAINADANVQALKDHFAARIMPGTIEPV